MSTNNDLFTGAIILFIVVGVLGINLTGSDDTFEDRWNSECLDNLDNDSNGDVDSQSDPECQDYPYSDGNGETSTQTVYPGSADDYEPLEDFFDYAEYSYPQAQLDGYPGTEIDWKCDNAIMGAGKYIKSYDIKFGTTVNDEFTQWVDINCIQAGNGILNNKGGTTPPAEGGEEEQPVKGEE